LFNFTVKIFEVDVKDSAPRPSIRDRNGRYSGNRSPPVQH